MENVIKQRDMKLATDEKRRNELVSKPSCRPPKWFFENLWSIEIKRARTDIKKQVYLGLSVMYISKILMNIFW